MLDTHSLSRTINARKRDRTRVPRPFEREIAVSLLGLKIPMSDWPDRAFDHLAEKCAYLIHVRGYEAWAI